MRTYFDYVRRGKGVQGRLMYKTTIEGRRKVRLSVAAAMTQQQAITQSMPAIEGTYSSAYFPFSQSEFTLSTRKAIYSFSRYIVAASGVT